MSGHHNNFQHYDPYYGLQHGTAMLQGDSAVPSLPQHRGSMPDFSSRSHTSLGESANAVGTSNAGVRARRRVGAGGEHVKHRRTRSGCYTCRNRRIKCDENRPICDRCKKGNRDCVYPESGLSSKTKRRDSRGSKPSRVDSMSSPSSDEGDGLIKDDGTEELPPLPEDDDLEAIGKYDMARPSTNRQNSSTQSVFQAKSPASSNGEAPSVLTQATEHSSASIDSYLSQQQPRSILTSRDQRWTDFPRDIQFYLNFFKSHINNYHYSFKYDYDDYLQTTFVDYAICYDRLLYAVVSFAAYHYSVSRKEGKIQDFLAYYNKSVTLLRLSLVQRQLPNLATLLTILQLATIEVRLPSTLPQPEANDIKEFLGDWVSLLSHQKAARQIFQSLFTLENVMQSETSRKVLDWYLRFDLVVGMLSGNGTFLGREWYEVRCQYYQRLSQEQPNNLGVLYKERFTENGIVCQDAAEIWAKRSRGEISEEEFNEQADEVAVRLTEYKARIPSLIMQTSRITINSNGTLQQDFANFAGSATTNSPPAESWWSGSLMLLDWWAVEMMFKHQLCGLRRQQPPADISGIAFEMLKTFEAIETHPGRPDGILIAAQGSPGVAGLFVPKDYMHSMWVRRKLAAVEATGYTYPNAFRQKMSNHWNADLTHWWLPNEENFPPLLRSIRSLIHDRSEGPQPDQMSESIRDMRGIFNNISLDENAPVESPSSITAPNDDRFKSRSSSIQDFSNVTIVNTNIWDAADMPTSQPIHWHPPNYG